MADPAAPIPFNRPCLAGREVEYVQSAIAAGHISGDGTFTRQCERLLQELLAARRVLLTTSGTHALEMAAMLLDLREGDEVIVPAYTFVTTAGAFQLRGARIVFCDVDPQTFNIDPAAAAALVTARTRAIVPVHYAGVGCQMDVICRLAEKQGFAIVEDNAHGLFGRFAGRPLGTWGRMSAVSFHETKNFQCGEGGAIFLSDPRDVEQAEVIREKGTNRSRFFRGEIDKYTWVGPGSSYVPSDMLAAFLLAQLEEREAILARRRAIWEAYLDGLRDWAPEVGAALPVVPPGREPSWHMFHLAMPTLESRTRFIAHMKERGIHCVFHYQALNASEMGRRLGGRPGQCPVAEAAADRVVRLPFFNDLDTASLERIVGAAREFR